MRQSKLWYKVVDEISEDVDWRKRVKCRCKVSERLKQAGERRGASTAEAFSSSVLIIWPLEQKTFTDPRVKDQQFNETLNHFKPHMYWIITFVFWMRPAATKMTPTLRRCPEKAEWIQNSSQFKAEQDLVFKCNTSFKVILLSSANHDMWEQQQSANLEVGTVWRTEFGLPLKLRIEKPSFKALLWNFYKLFKKLVLHHLCYAAQQMTQWAHLT